MSSVHYSVQQASFKDNTKDKFFPRLDVTILDAPEFTHIVEQGNLGTSDGDKVVGLPIGTNGQILSSISATDTGLEWVDLSVGAYFVYEIDLVIDSNLTNAMFRSDTNSLNCIRIAPGTYPLLSSINTTRNCTIIGSGKNATFITLPQNSVGSIIPVSSQFEHLTFQCSIISSGPGLISLSASSTYHHCNFNIVPTADDSSNHFLFDINSNFVDNNTVVEFTDCEFVLDNTGFSTVTFGFMIDPGNINVNATFIFRRCNFVIKTAKRESEVQGDFEPQFICAATKVGTQYTFKLYDCNFDVIYTSDDLLLNNGGFFTNRSNTQFEMYRCTTTITTPAFTPNRLVRAFLHDSGTSKIVGCNFTLNSGATAAADVACVEFSTTGTIQSHYNRFECNGKVGSNYTTLGGIFGSVDALSHCSFIGNNTAGANGYGYQLLSNENLFHNEFSGTDAIIDPASAGTPTYLQCTSLDPTVVELP